MGTPATRYSLPSILLHWTMALAMLLAWSGGQLAEALGHGPGRTLMLGGHALFGLAVLAMLLPRILARVLGGHPRPEGPAWARRLAAAAHLLLYALMVAVPLTGLFIALSGRVPFDLAGLATLPNSLAGAGWRGMVKETHEVLTNLLFGAVVLHLLAIVWHALVRGDSLATRMSLRGTAGSA